MGRAGDFSPGKLWSLWEIMRKLKSDEFFAAFQQCAVLQQAIQAFLEKEGGGASTKFAVLTPDFHEHQRQVAFLSSHLRELDFASSAICFDRAHDIMKQAHPMSVSGREFLYLEGIEAQKLQTQLQRGVARVTDDFTLQTVLIFSLTDQALFEKPKLFGDDVFNNFPSANEDISEAGTCLALNRATACVMHLMRVVEAGLAALANALGVPKQSDWGRYLREIDTELKKRMAASGARSVDEQFYAEVADTIDLMRRAYRNPTMHPEKTYSPDRAEEILQSVRSFMRHLATKIYE